MTFQVALMSAAAVPFLLGVAWYSLAEETPRYKVVSPDGKKHVEVSHKFALFHDYLIVKTISAGRTDVLVETRNFDGIIYFAQAAWDPGSRYVGLFVRDPKDYCIGYDVASRVKLDCGRIRDLVREEIQKRFRLPAGVDGLAWATTPEATARFDKEIDAPPANR